MVPVNRTTATGRELVLSVGSRFDRCTWSVALAAGLGSAGLAICRTYSRPETLGRVEQGGLAGAIVVSDREPQEGLSLLRGIRSISGDLPCWFVAREATRRTLESALTLQVSSVLIQPVNVSAFTWTLLRTLCDLDQPY